MIGGATFRAFGLAFALLSFVPFDAAADVPVQIEVQGAEGAANVQITNVRTGETRFRRTDAEGELNVQLEPGEVYKFEGLGLVTSFVRIEPGEGVTLYRFTAEARSRGLMTAGYLRLPERERDELGQEIGDPTKGAAEAKKEVEDRIEETETLLEQGLRYNAEAGAEVVKIGRLLDILAGLSFLQKGLERRLEEPDPSYFPEGPPVIEIPPGGSGDDSEPRPAEAQGQLRLELEPNTEFRVRNSRTGETQTVRSNDEGEVNVQAEHGDRLRVDGPNGRTRYYDVEEPMRGRKIAKEVDPAAPRDIGFFITPRLGFAEYELPRVGIGTVVLAPGNEVFLHRSDTRVSGTSTGLEAGYSVGRTGPFDDARVFASWEGAWGDEGSSGRVPIDGMPVAITYFEPAPNGSTGLALGPTGAQAGFDIELEAHRIAVGATASVPVNSDSTVRWGPYAAIVYERLQVDYLTRVQSLTFADIFSSARQEIMDEYVGPSIGVNLAVEPNDDLILTVRATADLLWRSSTLKSDQQNRCGLCAPPERVFNVSQRDEDDGFSYRLNLALGAEYQIMPGLSIGIAGGVSYLGDRGAIQNAAGPNQGPPSVGTEDALDYFGALRATFTF